MSEERIKIQYLNDEIEKLCYIDGKSDWIDLRAAEDVELKKGDFALIFIIFGILLQIMVNGVDKRIFDCFIR